MEDFIFTPIVLAVGLAIHAAVLRFHTAAEGKILTGSFALHVVSGIAQVLLVLYYFPGGGDMLGYYREGVALASLLRADFVEFAPRILLAFLQQDVQLPFEITTGGGATASMTAASAFVLFVSGDSLYASVQVVGIAAYVSQVMMYRALRGGVRPEQTQALLAGLLLLPSAVFWSSALLKEPLVFCSLGPLLLALQWLASGVRRISAVLIGLPAAVVIAVLKPYVLIALSVGGAVYYLSIRFRSRVVALRPFAVITALALSFGGMTLAARFFSKADSENAASALATQRRVGYDVEGGSNYYLDRSEGEDVANRSLVQELALAPLALITACYRPFLFEARNSVQLVNAIEATALLVISVQLVRRRRWRVLASEIRQSPVLAFCAAFALVLAVGTGLATSNLGTLSRYRAPMMPFFFALLMVLRYPLTLAARESRRSFVNSSIRPVEAE